MSEVLSIQDVSKSYRDQHALKKINLSVVSGQIFGLLGPNGAGKSTLLRIINNIISHDSGKVMINGNSLSEFSSRHIGYLPEERGLYKKMKVSEQLLYLAKLKGMSAFDAKREAQIWYDKLGVSEWRNKTLENLSKGMQQKIQFISTVIHKPEIIILDEPFSGFDPVNAALIKEQILSLKKEGVSILLSTHDMPSVEELCDKIALINDGEIVLEGRVQTVKKKFGADKFEVVFNGNVQAFTNALWIGAEVISFNESKEQITAIVSLTGRTEIKEIMTSILGAVEVISFRELLPSMNDIFLKVVNEQKVEA